MKSINQVVFYCEEDQSCGIFSAKSMAGLVMYAVKSGIIHGAPETDS